VFSILLAEFVIWMVCIAVKLNWAERQVKEFCEAASVGGSIEGLVDRGNVLRLEVELTPGSIRARAGYGPGR
jgi:hypothetical protein